MLKVRDGALQRMAVVQKIQRNPALFSFVRQFHRLPHLSQKVPHAEPARGPSTTAEGKSFDAVVLKVRCVL